MSHVGVVHGSIQTGWLDTVRSVLILLNQACLRSSSIYILENSLIPALISHPRTVHHPLFAFSFNYISGVTLTADFT
jgi:hypothetical protein